MAVLERISALRKKMQENQIDAFVVFSADPHMSEYLPEQWKERIWISGFTGSAGFVVFTQDKAALWTDGRYFTQAESELEGSGIELMKDGVENTPHYVDWIKNQIPENGKIALNSLATSSAQWAEIKNKIKGSNLVLTHNPLIDLIWEDRPKPSENEVFMQPIQWAGVSVKEKLENIRNEFERQNISGHLISSLDDVAWTLNLRGSDVEANPVFLGYIYLDKNQTFLFVNPKKLNQEAENQLKECGIQVVDYQDFLNFISEKISGERILVSPLVNQLSYETLSKNNEVITGAVIGNLMKAKKNEVELNGFRKVMQRDGVAMVKFIYWLKHNVGKISLDEYEIGQKLREFRAQGENFVGESFGSIVGYKGNGAIIHYSAPEKNSKKVEASGTILIDSGGQYFEGTTDITRVLALGEDVSIDFKRNYTLVLKGMINLSRVKFPKGTRGVQLDALARFPLWLEGKDYLHGTGHGVGSFMNVHEGPQNIRKDMNPTILEPGMVVSNEPGYYVVDGYGIRIENLISVKEVASDKKDESFLGFETLTICPISTELIIKDLMTEDEIQWLNDYHQFCKEKLENSLEGEVKTWFMEQVKPI